MNPKNIVSVVISFYNRIDYLNLVVAGFSRQSDPDFEIIIAEDNDDPANSTAIQGLRSQHPRLDIRHVSQPDIGFRKNKILNEATRIAQGELLVFVDGDCIPHRHFVRQHRLLARPRTASAGRRVSLGRQATEVLLRDRDLDRLSFFRLFFSDNRKIEESIYFRWLPAYFNRPRSLLGCNWSIHKSDLLAINGHDEDYQKAGAGEDVDIEWRLLKAGMQLASVKFRAIVYHMYHPVNYQEEVVLFNIDLMRKKQQEGSEFCQNGFHKIDAR